MMSLVGKQLSILVSLLLLAALSARSEETRGRLLDAETLMPVARAVVKATDESGNAVAFTSSGPKGEFRLNAGNKALRLSVKAIGYAETELPLPLEDPDILLCPKETQLKEVVVCAPDIYQRGDTLVFSINRYANATDNAIIDVIKRLPGVKVKDDGTIMYNGKPINKFYIEGNDFVGDQYGLAANNISKDDVKSVEVLENHQPVKALDDIEFSDQAAINIKMKEDAKDRWTGIVKAAGGFSPLLYDASLFTMRLAPRMQNIFTLKAADTGWNPTEEIIERDYDRLFEPSYNPDPWQQYISADRIASPLAESRTRFSTAWLADAITAWNAGDTGMRLKLDYSGDMPDSYCSSTTRYFSDMIPDFIQRNSLSSKSHKVAAQLNATVNKRGYYLKEKLKTEASTEKSNSRVGGSSSLRQTVDRKEIYAVNDLRLVKRNDKRLLTLSSRNEFLHNPTILNIYADDDSPSQDVTTTDFRSTTESQSGWIAGYWRVSLNAGIDIDYHRTKATLEGLSPAFDNSADYKAFSSSIYASAKGEYERGGWRASVSLPVKWSNYRVDGLHSFLNLSPSLWVRRQLSAKSEITLSAAYSLSGPQADSYIGCPIMCDYRNIFRSAATDRHFNAVSTGAVFKYSNPLNALFANASAFFQWSKSPLMTDQAFIGDLVLTSFKKTPGSARIASINGGLSKGLAHGRLVVGMDASFNQTSSASMLNGERMPFSQQSLSLEPYFKGSILKWLSANYDFRFNLNRLAIKGNDESHTSSFVQRLNIAVIPSERLHFSIGAEHYHTSFSKTDKAGLVLFDASAVWQPTARLRLSLTATNLLDRKEYRYTTFGTISMSEYSYRIRGRNILLGIQFRL